MRASPGIRPSSRRNILCTVSISRQSNRSVAVLSLLPFIDRVNDYCGGDISVAAEGLLARAGCTPGRSRHNAAMSQGTGWHPAGGLVINSAAHNAPRANSVALTSNAWANPMALAVPTLIRPIDPIDISAARRETPLLMAEARPLCSVGTDHTLNVADRAAIGQLGGDPPGVTTPAGQFGHGVINTVL